MGDETAAAQGRPRSEEASRKILMAAFHLFRDRGYSGLSMETVAEMAGVGKTTIYRRYPNKRELIMAAISMGAEIPAAPETGSCKRDLVELVGKGIDLMEGHGNAEGLRIWCGLVIERERDPELLEAFRKRFIRPHQQRYRSVFERGVENGELNPGADFEAATHATVGSIIARMTSGQTVPQDWAERIVDLVWPGIARVNDSRA